MSHSVLRHCLAALSLTLASATYGADAIIIGQVAPYSGPLAPTGSHVGAGAQLYFERINAAGGIHGAKIRLVTKDDGYKVVETVKLTRELLKQSSPIALVGMVGTGNVGALVKERVLADADIPVVGIRSGAMSLVTARRAIRKRHPGSCRRDPRSGITVRLPKGGIS